MDANSSGFKSVKERSLSEEVSAGSRRISGVFPRQEPDLLRGTGTKQDLM